MIWYKEIQPESLRLSSDFCGKALTAAPWLEGWKKKGLRTWNLAENWRCRSFLCDFRVLSHPKIKIGLFCWISIFFASNASEKKSCSFQAICPISLTHFQRSGLESTATPCVCKLHLVPCWRDPMAELGSEHTGIWEPKMAPQKLSDVSAGKSLYFLQTSLQVSLPCQSTP